MYCYVVIETLITVDYTISVLKLKYHISIFEIMGVVVSRAPLLKVVEITTEQKCSF